MATTSTRRRAMELLSAVIVPATTTAKDKQLSKGGNHTGDGFAPAALYPPLTSTPLRLAEDESLLLEQVERALLREVAPHTLHETWATDAVARKMPLDVVQRLPGCALLSTTVIYTRAERIRSIEEVAKLFGDAS